MSNVENVSGVAAKDAPPLLADAKVAMANVRRVTDTITEVCNSFGWPEVIDLGGIEGARLLEPLCILWVLYGVKTGGWNHAFKMLRK